MISSLLTLNVDVEVELVLRYASLLCAVLQVIVGADIDVEPIAQGFKGVKSWRPVGS